MVSRSSLRIAFCAANDIGSRVIERVVKDQFPIAFIATCADDSARYEEVIAKAADAHNIPLLRHANPNSPEFIEFIKEQEIDIMILAWWPGIIKAAAIAAARIGWLNMHPSLLPLGRGKHPYYWSMVEGVPHGVSLHFIDAGIDTGPILFQREVPIEMTDTGEDVYRRSNEALFELFLQHYADVATGQFTPQPQ
ncbi:MAG: hypothetical protein IT290_01575, partial [Deltaproteobacteria bacterium]|nr:hypothetical protein [Deltaproteobacteria bacterium]